MQDMQRSEFSSADFLGSNRPERVKKCQELAAEAKKLAAEAVNPDLREAYADLRRQWQLLADEIE